MCVCVYKAYLVGTLPHMYFLLKTTAMLLLTVLFAFLVVFQYS